MDFFVSPFPPAHLIKAVMADEIHCPVKPQSLPDLDNEAWLSAFRRGDRQAFRQLVEVHQQRVENLVHRLSGWADESQDLVQEVFVAAFRGARRFDSRSSLGTWLTRIAINVCRAERRKRLLHLRHWLALVSQRPQSHVPSKTNETQELVDQVTLQMQKLPTQYREVLVLRYLQHMPVRDIANVLDATVGAVELRLHRARHLLRERLPHLVDEI